MLATEARDAVVLSYLALARIEAPVRQIRRRRWLDARLEGRGVVVYPSSAFKRHISSKAAYMAALQERGLPVWPTQILLRGDCVGDDGAPAAARVGRRRRAALGARRARVFMSWLAGAKGFQLVSKPSNADGGFGVASWSGSLAQIVGKPAAADDDACAGGRGGGGGGRARGAAGFGCARC